MDAPIEFDVSHIRLQERPLIVCDVDDVVLHFFAPFLTFIEAEGHEFLPRSFRLTGNIVSKANGSALEEKDVHRLIGAFFEAQENGRHHSIAWSIRSANSRKTLTSFSSPPCRRSSGNRGGDCWTDWSLPIHCSRRCSRRGRSCARCTGGARSSRLRR